jgi:hypothetical protein
VQELITDAILEVLTAPSDGWSSDTRFRALLAPQEDGFLRIRSIAVIDKLQPAPHSCPECGWTMIKADHRFD